jgi:hypothetical protein
MAQFGMNASAGEVGCGYPDCGCCDDAACEDAIKQHPDFAPALTPAEKAGVGDGERDLPTEFEAWWETSAFHQARCDGYSQRKQLAWDAYYAASIRARAQPHSETRQEQR